MSHLVREFNVAPLYGQVAALDVEAVDIPDWVTGEEPAVASEHAVLVATRSDAEGEVTIRVFDGVEGVAGHVVFDGDIAVTQPAIEIGSIPGAVLERVALARVGYVSLTIRVDNLSVPAEISFAFERGVVVS